MRCLLFTVLLACGMCLLPGEGGAFFPSEEKQTGVVATVNGRPILLHSVESLYDMNGGADLLAHAPSVELLQRQYGDALAALIVYTLIDQELETRGLLITDEAVRAEEAAIRADYPSGAFEVMLQENAIELEAWRECVRARLAVRLFQKTVLRPRFTVSPEEIQAEYAANAALVEQPEKVHIAWVEDTDKKRLESVRNTWLADGTLPSETTRQGPDTQAGSRVDFLRISPTRLPETLRRDLSTLKPNQATPIRQERGVHFFAALLARVPARTLDLVEAYPLMEALVVERKLPDAYAEWVAEALTRADIRVAPQLQPHRRPQQKRRPQAREDSALPQSDTPRPAEDAGQEKGQD